MHGSWNRWESMQEIWREHDQAATVLLNNGKHKLVKLALHSFYVPVHRQGLETFATFATFSNICVYVLVHTQGLEISWNICKSYLMRIPRASSPQIAASEWLLVGLRHQRVRSESFRHAHVSWSTNGSWNRWGSMQEIWREQRLFPCFKV